MKVVEADVCSAICDRLILYSDSDSRRIEVWSGRKQLKSGGSADFYNRKTGLVQRIRCIYESLRSVLVSSPKI